MRFPLLGKVLVMGLVMGLVMVVMLRIEALVRERQHRQLQAAAGIEQSLAGAQTLLGPLLLRRCVEEWDAPAAEGSPRALNVATRTFDLVAAPISLQVDGQLQSEARYRGLFKVNGYAGPLTLQARWTSMADLQPRREHAGSRLHCEAPRIMLSVSDVRGLRSAQLLVDGQRLPVLPGTGHGSHARGLHATLPESRVEPGAQPLELRVTIELLGTARLALVPAAGETRLKLQGDWPHPSFGGRFLPSTREVRRDGFTAQWAVSALASSAALDVQRPAEICAPAVSPHHTSDGGEVAPERPTARGGACLDTLAVSFIDPVNPYVLTDRATKYALLFVVLTFVTVALTEVLAHRNVHPVQYTLVGLALAMFYLLLLSLAEHVPFGVAYAAASTACVLLLGFYARHMLGSWRAGAAFGTGIGVLYGALWTLLQLEQTALVIGSLLLFAALAAVMVLTRRVDWYALFGALRRRDPAQA